MDNYGYHYAVVAVADLQHSLHRYSARGRDPARPGQAHPSGVQQVQQAVQEGFRLGPRWKVQVVFLFLSILFLTKIIFSDALPSLLDHLSFLDKNIARPIREYNDCQVRAAAYDVD